MQISLIKTAAVQNYRSIVGSVRAKSTHLDSELVKSLWSEKN
jgi:hypothetical protein